MAPSTVKRVRFECLGCRLNEAEVESWARGLQGAGLEVVGAGPADVVVINTCAVTAEAERQSRALVRRLQRQVPGARLVVSGCAVSLAGQPGIALSASDLVVPNRDKERLIEQVIALLGIFSKPRPIDPAQVLLTRGRQRAFIKVQDGCRHRCTFCLTCWIRGPERSRPLEAILAEVHALERAGIQEIVLTGVHLGGYGRGQGIDLAHLIERLLAETAIPRIRLGSLEPWSLPPGLWSLFADPRLMPHLHLPLQSGSDRVLKWMGRRYRQADYVRLVERARAAIPDLNLTTDLIAGFPGEGEEDWQETLALAEALRFGHIHAFGYSPRSGTPAARFPDQVDVQTRRARVQRLESIVRRSRLAVMRDQLGKRMVLLCEHPSPQSNQRIRLGYTPNYLPVALQVPTLPAPGTLIEVRIAGIDEQADCLLAEPVLSV
ncbi:tRNA (N(6)-L-threonylcarbamoyladenosine(37)-C(2))-methylthiotransferase MtaB [Caldichromatium japonicum]|uniref:tRNA (N(6)-L-threonylcarbamoyladenosine(37)-C(2))-methylthiotransferase MtaB n=1 Tax=Caldichromatium japonicum TaxID=2699430 RepID=A0A6G7VBZ6_9GAMM|nr:tRNA (N(6)-L-threonylcarbamoyladenosine(37)-C(2))-methylthiotransferase MtaB [Caldichromatium japonicum]QIK37541.1 tRNA (N(6)-L-threonylcarbamoyladenosine(37)-C(2))-methylthiotransferase MtaB [Caldichromatium japonicum]